MDKENLGNSQDREVLVERQVSIYASSRAVMYAIASDLAASPFDAKPAVADSRVCINDLNLPYHLIGFQELFDDWRNKEFNELKREYSGLFEVGSDGPPVPIREDLHLNQPAGIREDIIRFYEFFGYKLEENFAWAPDHLSVELEFMHFLIYKESESLDPDHARSFQLAQYDFSERHLCNWIPELVDRIHSQGPNLFYCSVIEKINNFLQQDFDWQRSTINHH